MIDKLNETDITVQERHNIYPRRQQSTGQGYYRRLFVCLSVCLSARYHENAADMITKLAVEMLSPENPFILGSNGQGH